MNAWSQKKDKDQSQERRSGPASTAAHVEPSVVMSWQSHAHARSPAARGSLSLANPALRSDASKYFNNHWSSPATSMTSGHHSLAGDHQTRGLVMVESPVCMFFVLSLSMINVPAPSHVVDGVRSCLSGFSV